MDPILKAAPEWAAEIEAAKEIDKLAMRYGQGDPSHHLCAEQRSQQRRGFLSVHIMKNKYGWCVRDRMNDGLGNISGNGSLQFACEYAVRMWQEGRGKVEVEAWDAEVQEALREAAKAIA
jgi:hypothetical protein